MSEIKFGTDGWRGIISDDFTFDNVRRVGAAIADYYTAKAPSFAKASQDSSPKFQRRRTQNLRKTAKLVMAVGYDTRFLSETYARIISEVLAGKGIEVILSDRAIPTPALSLAVKLKNIAAGVMITASHNPAIYNGIKIKTRSGGAAGVEVTQEIEKMLTRMSGHEHQDINVSGAGKISKADLNKEYVDFLRSYIDFKKLKKARFRVLVDAMYGSGNGFIADVLRGTRIKLDFIRNQINPSFGGLRPEPILENLGPTIMQLKKQQYDLVLVLDGDADRIAGFAGNGEFIHSQKILALLTLHLVRNRGMSGGVVKTVAGTTLIDKITACLGLRLYETQVGFKYISELMEKADILIGGEEAGGIGFKGYIPERDGILAGLLLLEMMAYQKKSILKILNEMEQQFGRYYYLRDGVRLKPQAARGISSKISRFTPLEISPTQKKIAKILTGFKSKKELLSKRVTQIKDFDGVKLICEDESWLMLRSSGTEPLVRVYAEARSLTRSKQLLNFGKNLIGL